MQTVCIFVIGLLYAATCHTNPDVYPIGVCHQIEESTVYCTATPEQFFVRSQVYHPTWGGINCVDPCNLLGGGSTVESGYDLVVACPLGMFEQVIIIEQAGTWTCLDHGGEIRLQFGRIYTQTGHKYMWYIPVDHLLRPDEPYPNWLYGVWRWRFEE